MTYRSSSTASLEKSNGSIRRRSSTKERSKSADGNAAPPPKPATKLIEAEKSETGRVIQLDIVFTFETDDCFYSFPGQLSCLCPLFEINRRLVVLLDLVTLRHLSSMSCVFNNSIVPVLIFHSFLFQGFSVYSNVWLSKWSEAGNNITKSEQDLYLGVYGALGFGQGKHFKLSFTVYP